MERGASHSSWKCAQTFIKRKISKGIDCEREASVALYHQPERHTRDPRVIHVSVPPAESVARLAKWPRIAHSTPGGQPVDGVRGHHTQRLQGTGTARYYQARPRWGCSCAWRPRTGPRRAAP